MDQVYEILALENNGDLSQTLVVVVPNNKKLLVN